MQTNSQKSVGFLTFFYNTVRRLVKNGVFWICFLRTVKSIGNQKENRTLKVRCIFWWESACTNRAEKEFADLMQRVKEFKEKYLISPNG